MAAAADFAGAAARYWLSVHPAMRRELRRWRARAAGVPDPELRRLALIAQSAKAGSVEGGAAFAAFAASPRRDVVLRALVIYQTAFDYLDLLAEQPSADQIGNGRRLHLALLAATDPRAGHIDYYAHHPRRADAGYLRAMVDACRAALGALPAHGLVLAPLRQASARIVAYQSYNHGDAAGSHRAFEVWGRRAARAHRARHSGDGLSWWELSAAAGSSMPVFALLAAAAEPALRAPEVAAIERVYHPRIGALNSLLDSLVDRHEDRAPRQNQLLGHYASTRHAVTRLRAIAVEAMRDTRDLPRAGGHRLILVALVCYYLHELGAAVTPAERAALAGAVGGLAGPTLLVFRARAAVAGLRRGQVMPSSVTR